MYSLISSGIAFILDSENRLNLSGTKRSDLERRSSFALGPLCRTGGFHLLLNSSLHSCRDACRQAELPCASRGGSPLTALIPAAPPRVIENHSFLSSRLTTSCEGY